MELSCAWNNGRLAPAAVDVADAVETTAVETTAPAPAVWDDEPQLPTTVITAARPWQMVNGGELWRHRELLFFLVWRDVKVRYKQTALGAAWALAQPLSLMLVFCLLFSRLPQDAAGGVPYPLFVFAGLLPWTFFATAVSHAGNSMIGSEKLITKVYFPRLAIPFASVGASLVDFAVGLLGLAAMMAVYGVRPQWGLLLVPVLMGLALLAALGIGTLLAALNVAYRDFRYVIPFLIQLWLFATPSVYLRSGWHAVNPTADGQTANNLSDTAHQLLLLNPMTGLISSFRAATLGEPLDFMQLGLSTAVILALFFAGCMYFRNVEDSFADRI